MNLLGELMQPNDFEAHENSLWKRQNVLGIDDQSLRWSGRGVARVDALGLHEGTLQPCGVCLEFLELLHFPLQLDLRIYNNPPRADKSVSFKFFAI